MADNECNKCGKTTELAREWGICSVCFQIETDNWIEQMLEEADEE